MSTDALSRSIVADALQLQEIIKLRDSEFDNEKKAFEIQCKEKLAEQQKTGDKIVSDSKAKAKDIIEAATRIKEAMLRETENWEEEKVKIAQIQKFDNASIKLDVGGATFTTSMVTLCRFPETMIGAMFSGRHILNKNEDGVFFIDRDGTHFRHILNFLRNPDSYSVDLSVAHKVELKKEVAFYGLDELMFPFIPAAAKLMRCADGQIRKL